MKDLGSKRCMKATLTKKFRIVIPNNQHLSELSLFKQIAVTTVITS